MSDGWSEFKGAASLDGCYQDFRFAQFSYIDGKLMFRVREPYAEPAPDVEFDWGNEKEVARITKAAKEALKDMQKPPKRATFWLTNGRVFQSAREAKTAYPGSDPVRVRECKK